MTQRDMRMIGGLYRLGQVIATNGLLAISTAYNHNTNDVVGLFTIEYPATLAPQMVRQLLLPLQQRKLVQSPQVLALHNWGTDGLCVYIATDPPRGTTLRHVLNTENIELFRALDMIRQLAIGLKAFHEHSIMGIDLRPQLITVDQLGRADRVLIDDIGLRSLLNALGYQPAQPDSRSEDIGDLDPRYAPPEYINRSKVGPWSDIYQLGLLLFELVTGRPPFVGRTPAETGVMQNTSPVPRMAQYNHETPESLQEVIDCALEKEPTKRFASAMAFLTALDSIELLDERTIKSQPIKSASLTSEMPMVDGEDVALQKTHIDGQQPAPPASEKLPSILNGEEVFAYLCFEKEKEADQCFPIMERNVIIGRSDPKRAFTPDIDLTALDPNMTVSRQHARIRFEKTFFYIEDLKSHNKSRLGELVLTPLKAEMLQHGDVLYFGSIRLKFRIPGMRDIPQIQDKPSQVG